MLYCKVNVKKGTMGMRELVYIALGLSVALILLFMFINKFEFAENVGAECEKNDAKCVLKEQCAAKMYLPFPCEAGTKEICCPRQSLFNSGETHD